MIALLTVTMAMVATSMPVTTSPAAAAGEVLTVLLDQRDGTPGFDADDNPGNDSGPANGVVRTNDNLEYTVEVRVEGGVASNVTVAIPLPQGVEADVLPPFCGAGSSITPPTLPAPAVPATATS